MNSSPSIPDSAGTLSADDLIVISVYTESVTGNALSVSGFTEMVSGDLVNGSASRSNVFWKRAAGGESGTITVSQTTGGGAGKVIAASIEVFNGVLETGTPYEALSSVTRTSASSMTGLAAGPATSDRSLGVHIGLLGGQIIWNDAATGWTQVNSGPINTSTGGDAGRVMHIGAVDDTATLAAPTEGGMGLSTEAHFYAFVLKPRG